MTLAPPHVQAAGFISRSHRAIAPFQLTRATTVAEAVERVAAGAAVHAGGIDVVERLQSGARIEALVDIGGVQGLDVIEVDDGVLRIGAAVTHDRIESDAVITEHRPDLAAAWRTVGNVRIRRTGTVGGNLMAFDPTYDAAPILAAAGAELVFASTEGEVRASVADRPSSLLLTHIEVPLDGDLRFDRDLKPVVTVAVDRCIAIGCAHGAVQVIERPTSAADLDNALAALPEPTGDAEASAAYRRRMIDVLVRRLTEGVGR